MQSVVVSLHEGTAEQFDLLLSRAFSLGTVGAVLKLSRSFSFFGTAEAVAALTASFPNIVLEANTPGELE